MEKQLSLLTIFLLVFGMVFSSAFVLAQNSPQIINPDSNFYDPSNLVCATDEGLLEKVISYKDGGTTFSELLECISIWNIAHPTDYEKERMSKLVSCIVAYKNGEKTFSELLECIQDFNLSKPQCLSPIDCKDLNHIEVPGEWACVSNKCVWDTNPLQKPEKEGSYSSNDDSEDDNSVNEEGSISEVKVRITEITNEAGEIIKRIGVEKTKEKSFGEDGEIEVETKLEVEEEVDTENNQPKIKLRLSNAERKELKILPDQASEIARERLKARNLTKIELREILHKNIPAVVYHIEGDKPGIFLCNI